MVIQVVSVQVASNFSGLGRVSPVARNEDLFEQIGRDIYFDLVDHDKVSSFRIKKQMPFNLFKEVGAKELGVPVQFQRFWFWKRRPNHTYRPKRPLTLQEEIKSLRELGEVPNNAHTAELKLFLEEEIGPELHPIPPPDRTKEDILLFFKLYDAEKEELRYAGRLFVKLGGKPLEILKKLNEMVSFSPDKEIELYEEIKFEPTVMCEHIDTKLTFRTSQVIWMKRIIYLWDIICFQKPASADTMTLWRRYLDGPSFLEYIHNRQVVHFRSLEKPEEDDFCLELSKLLTYDDATGKVARHLGLDDPTKIRLTPHNCYSQQPKSQAIKYQVDHLPAMLIHYNQVELSHPDVKLRLLEVLYHKIYKIFPPNEKIKNVSDQYWTLCAEEVS
ncbi:hypothetical protein MKX01_002837 [Papaver californicum]|nr:hypothetical protein MKX01_002837 [Papaver californicum]